MRPGDKRVPDIVIPVASDSVRHASKHQNLELRYTLRSIEAYTEGLDDIVILGAKPPWLGGVRHIETPDALGQKSRNTGYKFYIEMQRRQDLWMDQRSPHFWWWADDIFLTKPFDLGLPRMYYDGTIESFVERITAVSGASEYCRLMHRSLAVVQFSKTWGMPNFAVHRPMAFFWEEMNLARLRQVWEPRNNLAISQFVGNVLQQGIIEPATDLKLRGVGKDTPELLVREGMFSIANHFLRDAGRRLLEALYPRPSRWELD